MAFRGSVLASASCLVAPLVMTLVDAPPAGAQAQAAQAAPAALSPAAHIAHGECLVTGVPATNTGTAALVVPPHSTGVRLIWMPGLNSTPCAIVTTHAGASTAVALGRAITHAPAVPHGTTRFCPEDDGARVALSFTYAHHRSLAPLIVDLGGCRFISQSGKEQLSTSAAVQGQLAALAPCRWLTYFPGTPKACSS